MEAPVSKCVLVYAKLYNREVVYDSVVYHAATLKDKITLADDFSTLNIRTQPEQTVRVVISDDCSEVVLYVKEQTLSQIEYFKQIIQDTSAYEIIVKADCSIMQSIILFVENNVAFPFSTACFEQQFAAIDFLQIRRLRNEAMSFISQNFVDLGQCIAFNGILRQKDCETLLILKSIVKYCLESGCYKEHDAFSSNSIVDALLLHIIAEFEQQYSNRFLICSVCQAVCLSEVADKFQNSLICDEAANVCHRFEYRLNILGIIKQQFETLCWYISKPTHKFNYFCFLLKTGTVVLCGASTVLLKNLAFETVVYQCDVFKKYKIASELANLRYCSTIFQVEERITASGAENYHFVAKKQEYACQSVEITGSAAFCTLEFAYPRKKLMNSTTVLEKLERAETPPHELETLGIPDINEERTEESSSEDINTCAEKYAPYQLFISKFMHQQIKFNKYMQLKPYINERQQKSLLRESCSAEMRYKMREIAFDLGLQQSGYDSSYNNILNQVFLRIDCHSLLRGQK